MKTHIIILCLYTNKIADKFCLFWQVNRCIFMPGYRIHIFATNESSSTLTQYPEITMLKSDHPISIAKLLQWLHAAEAFDYGAPFVSKFILKSLF